MRTAFPLCYSYFFSLPVNFYSVVLEGRAFVWVDELHGNVELAVLHHHCRGLWFEADIAGGFYI